MTRGSQGGCQCRKQVDRGGNEGSRTTGGSDEEGHRGVMGGPVGIMRGAGG